MQYTKISAGIEYRLKLSERLRTSGVLVLAVWAKNHLIFIPAGAEGYKKYIKDLEMHCLAASQFELEANEVEMAKLMIDFFEKHGI